MQPPLLYVPPSDLYPVRHIFSNSLRYEAPRGKVTIMEPVEEDSARAAISTEEKSKAATYLRFTMYDLCILTKSEGGRRSRKFFIVMREMIRRSLQ